MISKLLGQLRTFGNLMYAPNCSDDCAAAEETVFNVALTRSARMTATKRERCLYEGKGVMLRYRRMHQGGQSAAEDPFASPEWFKRWLDDVYGASLRLCAWARD